MMSTPASQYLAAGQAALATADWSAAQAAFQAALQEQDTPETHDGLGIALWWLNDIGAAHEHRAAAYTAYRQRGDLRPAALIAVWLAREQVFLHSNASAMNGWFARAERLLQAAGPGVEHGWFALFHASMSAPPDQLEHIAFEAIDTARTYGDTDLEVAALAFGGLARVTLGRVSNGLTCLDEAMAAATGGEVRDFKVVSEVFCVMLSTCELAGDWERTEHWCRAAQDYAARYNCSFLSAYCRTTYGGLLTATGRWREAETELVAAIRAFEAGHRGLRVHAVLRLAELRVYQGRLEEAAVLLRGFEDYGGALVSLARLHLARHEPELAGALLDQTLRTAQTPMLSHAPLLSLRVEVALELGDTDAAHAAVEQLAAIAEYAHSDLWRAQTDIARGRIARQHAGDDTARYFRSALTHLAHYEQSLLASRAKLELARSLRERDRAGALTWARAALATFERLGATQDADEAANVLRELGGTVCTGPRQNTSLTPRESAVLALLAHGLANREIAERLVITTKTVEHHVSQILTKLGLRSRAEAAAYATQNPITAE